MRVLEGVSSPPDSPGGFFLPFFFTSPEIQFFCLVMIIQGVGYLWTNYSQINIGYTSSGGFDRLQNQYRSGRFRVRRVGE